MLTKKQKKKAAINLGLWLIAIPIVALTALYFILENINAENISNPLKKGLVVLTWAVIIGSAASVIIYLRVIYSMYFQTTTISDENKEIKDNTQKIDYHNTIYWMMSFFLAALLIIAILKKGF